MPRAARGRTCFPKVPAPLYSASDIATIARSVPCPPARLHLQRLHAAGLIHTGAWRYPGAWPDMNFNFAHIKRCIQTLERGQVRRLLHGRPHGRAEHADGRAQAQPHRRPRSSRSRCCRRCRRRTEHIGLVATGSTTFDAPYHIARRFASLDHLSNGRAGWNIVTTSNPDAALNFGMDEHMEHGERYQRAREFYDVVTGLWDSWADDAFVRDVESGMFFDPDKMHVLDHKGEYLSVRGPLNIARPVQGWPVIVQAGASESGRQLAAETAEAVFTALPNMKVGPGVLRRREGPDEEGSAAIRDHMKILPACFVVVGETVEEAQPKRAKLDSLVQLRQRHRLAVDRARPRRLEVRSGRAAAGRHPGEQRLQERPRARHRAGASARTSPCASSRSAWAAIPALPWSARRRPSPTRWRNGWMTEGLRRLHRPCSPICPAGSTISASSVVPELQRRGLFRREYEGTTLRENLGLPRPENRFFARKAAAPPNEHERDHRTTTPMSITTPRPASRRDKLCKAAGETFGVKVGRMHDNPVGPHPRGSCQLTDRRSSSSPTVIPWLVDQPGGLTVFTHAADRQRAQGPHRSRDLARAVRAAQAFSAGLKLTQGRP